MRLFVVFQRPSGSGSSSTATTSCTKSGLSHLLLKPGVLTVGTDNPVFTPWFVNNTPTNGKGYESAVAYAVAAQLGFSKSDVTWVHEPFNSVYAPGPKPFDFDINEVSVTPQRAQAVTFSRSYYPVQQSIVALKGTPIVTKHSPAQLKTYQYGDQIGTTGLTFINSSIQPTKTPKVFNTLALAASALAAHRIDALITDTPTAQYMVVFPAQARGAGRPVPDRRRALRPGAGQGQPAGELREHGAGQAGQQRHADRAPAQVAGDLPEVPDDQALA